MLTRILHNNEELCTFVRQLGLRLSAPQLRHVINIADALLVTDAHKTLAELQRQFVEAVDPSNFADTLRIAPWKAGDISSRLYPFLIRTALERLRQQGQPLRLIISLDDSLAIKDPDTHHLQGVDWHYYHAHKCKKRERLQNGLAYVQCNIFAGDWNFTFAIVPYLRQKTVRRLNRSRSPHQRLRFTSKKRIAQHILQTCRRLIPSDVAVYVQFDSWYASARLINYIRRQGWHAIFRIEPNRNLDKERVHQRYLAQRHQRYVRVDVSATDGTKRTYLVRTMTGRLNRVPFDVCVLATRGHYRDRHPMYFVSTDLTLTPHGVLQRYAKRWVCETDNLYLKQRLGLGDFRVQSYEAIDKFRAIVHLSWAYVQWRLGKVQGNSVRNPADVIRLHRGEHARAWLVGACQQALACGSVEPVIQRFLRGSA